MRLKDLMEKYGEYEVDLKKVVGKTEIESVTIDLTKPKPKTVWDLKSRDKCWTSDETGGITHERYGDGLFNDERRELGNVFLTEKEAKKDIERRKVETLLLKHGGRRWFDGHNHNYHIGLDEYERHLKAYILMTPTQGTIYFDTSARAQKAIDEIGTDRIKRALFEVR